MNEIQSTTAGSAEIITGVSGWSVWAFLVFLIGMTLAIYLAQWLITRRLRMRRLRRRLVQKGFSPEETALLLNMARKYAAVRISDIAERIPVFEDAVEKHLRKLERAGKDVGETAGLIARIRVGLGFLRPPGVKYFSTREIETGQLFEITCRIDGEIINARGVAGERCEERLNIVYMQPAEERMENAKAEVCFLSNDGRRFSFRTTLSDVNPENKRCRAEHTNSVNRTDKRIARRVTIEAPARWRLANEDEDSWQNGSLIDLNPFGAALSCLDDIGVGSELILKIPTGDCLMSPPPDRENIDPIVEVRGNIVGASGRRNGGAYRYSVEFLESELEQQDMICRTLALLDRQRCGAAYGEDASGGGE